MKFFSFLLQISRGTVAIAILAGIISGISSTCLIILLLSALNSGRWPTVNLILAFIGLCLLKLFTGVGSQILLVRLGEKAILNLRLHLSRQILATPLRKLEEIGANRILATLTDDVVSLANALTCIPILCISLAIVVGCIIYLSYLSLSLIGTILGLTAIGLFVYQIAVKRALRYLKSAREEQDAMFKHLQALTTGIKELKLNAFRRERFVSHHLGQSARSFQRNNIIGMSIYIVANSLGNLFFLVIIGLLLFLLPLFKELDFHTSTGYVVTILYMMSPVEFIAALLPTLGRANVALKKVNNLGFSLAALPSKTVNTIRPDVRLDLKRLELIGVIHTYYNEREDTSFVLGPLDLVLLPGEVVFLTGGNGSGKTTLAKLLIGLYLPEAGEIQLNGQTVTEGNIEFYRQHFSAVFSDFFLFKDLFGINRPDSDVKAREYISQFHLASKVKVEDGMFSTTDLSRGQAKRLALVTAYLEDRPIYVFDEWASDQDPSFKEVFYHHILPELRSRGKTVLAITHDEHYYDVADRLIKLDSGKLEYDKQCPRE